MASPRLESYCCPNHKSATAMVLKFRPDVYNGLCLVSASLSVVGVAFQNLPHGHRVGQQLGPLRAPKPRSAAGSIVRMLTTCDILACLGIIVRSTVWLSAPAFVDGISMRNNSSVLPGIFCASTSVWIQFFYSANFLWAFCYAADSYLTMKRAAGKRCEENVEHAIPHYVSTYMPMLLVFLVCPVLYIRTMRAVSSVLKSRHGIYSENERQLERAVKIRFLQIMLVFYICWLPNVINEVLLFVKELYPGFERKINENIKITILMTWNMMAIINPMQGLLNSLVYYGWRGCTGLAFWKRRLEPVWSSRVITRLESGLNELSHPPLDDDVCTFHDNGGRVIEDLMTSGTHTLDSLCNLTVESKYPKILAFWHTLHHFVFDVPGTFYDVFLFALQVLRKRPLSWRLYD
uniref:G protein-coupled receptor 143 n=1 Tax=Eptatretus burgeri TaxID=7764 RepID=A0A8C4QZK2_EPTBU